MDVIEFKRMRYYNTIEYEYMNLCERGDCRPSLFFIPFVGDLNKEVIQSVEMKMADNLINEAIGRGDYEIYGMDKLTFQNEAYTGRIEGFRNLIPQLDINTSVYNFLTNLNISHTDYFGDVVNSPVRCVW